MSQWLERPNGRRTRSAAELETKMKDLQRELGEMRHDLQARRARETALDNMEDDKPSRQFQTEIAGDTDTRTVSPISRLFVDTVVNRVRTRCPSVQLVGEDLLRLPTLPFELRLIALKRHLLPLVQNKRPTEMRSKIASFSVAESFHLSGFFPRQDVSSRTRSRDGSRGPLATIERRLLLKCRR